MKTKTLLPTLLCVGFLCVLNTQAAGTNIVQNGGFGSPNGTFIPGWTYDGYIWVPQNPPGADGGPFVGLSKYMEQILPTQPGQSYLLQFSIRATLPYIGQSGPYGLAVSWGSQSPLDFNMTNKLDQWLPEQLTLTATSTQTLLDFTSIYGANPFLDAVSVTAVPEPETLSLAVLGFGLVMGLRKIKR